MPKPVVVQMAYLGHILLQLFSDELAVYILLSSFSTDIVTKNYFDRIFTSFR